MYCVYEHWYKGKCFYVGSGNLKRPFSKQKGSRNDDWWKYFNGDSKNLRIEIIGDNLSYEESCKLEDEITIKRIKENQPLANKIIGRHSIVSEETKRKIGLKNKENYKNGSPATGTKLSKETKMKISNSLKGENNPLYGKKRSKDFRDKISKAISKKTILEIDDKKIEFESRIKCIEYCKVNSICSRNSVVRSTEGNIPKMFNDKKIKIYYREERGN